MSQSWSFLMRSNKRLILLLKTQGVSYWLKMLLATTEVSETYSYEAGSLSLYVCPSQITNSMHLIPNS